MPHRDRRRSCQRSPGQVAPSRPGAPADPPPAWRARPETRGLHGCKPSARRTGRVSPPTSTPPDQARWRPRLRASGLSSAARAPPAWGHHRRFRQRPRRPPSDNLQRFEEVGDAFRAFTLVLDDFSRLARLGRRGVDHFLRQCSLAGLAVQADVAQPDLLHFLVLGLHDAAQCGIARLIDTTGYGHDRRQRGLDDVVAIVRLAVDHGLALRDLEPLGKTEERQPEELGELRRHCTRGAVGALRAADDQVVGLPLDGGRNGARGADGIGVFQRRIGDENASIGAHRKRPSNRVHRLGRAHGDNRDLAGIFFDQLEAGLDTMLIPGVEHEVDALPHQAFGLRIELARRVGIGNLLDADEDIHGWRYPLWINPARSNGCLYYDWEPRMPRTEYFEIVAKSALNRVQHMGFNWSLNPYQGCFHSCVYCFARAHAKLADRDPGAGFSARVGVKVNVPELLRRELSRRSWKRETVAFGTATDPYQPIEGTYRLTRRCLEAFRDFRTPVGLITKGTMVIRDIDVLAELSRRAKATVCFSIPTVDEPVWARTEPGTPPPQKRLKVLKALVDARIQAGVGMAPVLPGLCDSPGQLEATVAAAANAGACFVWANIVYLKPGTKEHFMEFLGRDYPRLLSRYRDLFPGAYAPASAKAPVMAAVAGLKRRYDISDRRAWRAEPPPEPGQLGLAV